MIDICSIIQENAAYIRENNIFHFILDASERPWWSKQLEDYYMNSGVKLNMVQNYKSQRRIMTLERCRKRFMDFVSDKQGVKVDLASGPSGYFSEIIENLTGNDLFIVTDASRCV